MPNISVANIIQNFTTGSITSATTASVTPGSNKLQLLTVESRTGITANPNQPTVTGNSLTWVAIASVVFDDTSSSRRRLTLFRALGASPSSGTIAIDLGGQTQSSIDWILDEVSNIDTSGTNGSAAILQSNTNFDDTALVSSVGVSITSSKQNAGVYGTFGHANGTATITVRSGYTKIGEIADTGIDTKIFTEFRLIAGETFVDFTSGTNGEVGGIAIELRAQMPNKVVQVNQAVKRAATY